MKNNKFTKISFVILALALCVGAVFAMSAGAQEAQKKPEIISENVAYQGDFALLYAVDASTVTGPVELYIYETEPTTSTPYKYKYTVSTVTPAEETGNLGKAAYIFRTAGVAAAAMSTEFYIQAVDTATNLKSDVKRYSVAEYLYERLASADATVAQKKLYNSVIAFGDNAQIVIGGKAEDAEDLVSKLRYVTVEGGTINGYQNGVYPIGTTLTPVVDGGAVSATWNIYTYDEAGAVTGPATSETVEVVNATKILVTQGTVINYKAGTESFGTYNPGDALPSFIGGSDVKSFVTDDKAHGTALKMSFTATNQYVSINPNASTVSETEATAFEISFDIKVDPKTSSEKYVILRFGENAHSGTWITGVRIDVASDYRYVACEDGPGYGSTGDDYTKSAADWFNIRMVMYDGEKALYVYLDGASTPAFVIDTVGSSGINTSYSGNIEDLFFEFLPKKTTDCDIYIDNVYCAYTMDKKPAE